MIIAFANHKGGVGKTSLAVLLTQWAIENNLPVKLYDLDGQQNFKFLMQLWREDLPVSDKLPAKFDDSVISIVDTAPGIGELAERAIRKADKVIVPVDTAATAILGISDIVGSCKSPVIAVNKCKKGYASIQATIADLKNNFKKYAKVVELPDSYLFATNISNGETWHFRMSDSVAAPFNSLINTIFDVEEE